MSIYRSYLIEHDERKSAVASEVEDYLKQYLNNKNVSPNTSRYYLDQIKNSLDLNHKTSSKMTVADMVNDLMKRTGLQDYIEQIKSNEFLDSVKFAEHQISFIDVEEFRKAIDNYILNWKSTSAIGVIMSDDIKQIVEKLKRENKIPQELQDVSLQNDKKLLNYINSIVANNLNNALYSDSIYSQTAAPDLAGSDSGPGTEWNKNS